MSLPNDFKSLEKELSRLEKDFDNFNRDFDKTCDRIYNLKFNDRKYNENAIEKRILNIIRDYKNNILNYFYILELQVDETSKKSLELIEKETKEVTDFINGLNNTLKSIEELNNLYLSRDYNNSILKAEEILKNEQDEKTKKYALLIELESYDSICKSKLENISSGDYSFFKEYYLKSLNNYAKNHIELSNEKLFLGICLLLNNYGSSFKLDTLFEFSYEALKCYSSFSFDNKNKYLNEYNNVYSKSINYFNRYSKELYESFEYFKVKEVLNKIDFYNVKDIKIDFFKNKDLDALKVFSYLQEYGKNGNLENLNLAFNDTKELINADKSDDFLIYWCELYNLTDFRFIEEIIKIYNDKYHAFCVIAESFYINFSNINNKDNLIKSLYESYNNFLISEELVFFNDFIDSAISINNLIDTYYINKTTESLKYIEKFDNIFFYMIKRYSKYCGYYSKDKIKILNKILENSSLRLFNKRKYKAIIRNTKKTQNDIQNLNVKLYVSETNFKKKTSIILVITLVSFILILSVILIIIYTY